MRTFNPHIFIILCLVLAAGCSNHLNKPTQTQREASSVPENVVASNEDAGAHFADSVATARPVGDYNGDGKTETMWLDAPIIKEGELDCIGGCTSYIRFSDATIPAIPVPQCISGIPTNHGDLNHNGTDEISLEPGWFMSYWSTYHVWTFTKGQWIHAIKPFTTHASQWEEGVIPIEADARREGHVIIHYSAITDAGIVTKAKSVKIAK